MPQGRVATAAAAGEREAVRRFSVVKGVLAKPFELDDLLKAVSGCANVSATAST